MKRVMLWDQWEASVADWRVWGSGERERVCMRVRARSACIRYGAYFSLLVGANEDTGG